MRHMNAIKKSAMIVVGKDKRVLWEKKTETNKKARIEGTVPLESGETRSIKDEMDYQRNFVKENLGAATFSAFLSFSPRRRRKHTYRSPMSRVYAATLQMEPEPAYIKEFTQGIYPVQTE